MDADPDVAVRYYGSGIPSLLDRDEQIHRPVLFRFGDEDQLHPARAGGARRDVRRAHRRRNMECHIQDDGGHAFVNHDAPMFHTPEAAARAREPIEAFPGRVRSRPESPAQGIRVVLRNAPSADRQMNRAGHVDAVGQPRQVHVVDLHSRVDVGPALR